MKCELKYRLNKRQILSESLYLCAAALKNLHSALRFCLLLIVYVKMGYAQSNKIVLKTFVQDGVVYLKWSPVDQPNFELGLKNGYEIKSVDAAGTKIIHTIKSPYSVLDSLEANKLTIPQSYFLPAALKSKKANDKTKKQAFAMGMIQCSYDKASSLANGLIFQHKSTEKLTYQIQIKGTAITSNTIAVDPTTLSSNKSIVLKPGIVEKKTITLEWESQSLLGDYAAYWPERSEDNVHFTRIAKAPVVFFKSQFEKNKTQCYYTDTSCIQGKKYFYRLTGINHVCLETKTSNVIEVYLKKSFEIAVYIDTITVRKQEKTIAVKLDAKKLEDLKHVDNYILQTSPFPTKGFKTVLKLPINAQVKFTFTDTVSRSKTHYRAGIVSVDGDTVFSSPYYFFKRDDVPPDQPNNLTGSIDEKGIVTLNWTQNREKDLMGYKLFWRNKYNEEFVEKTIRMIGNSFTDTIPLNNLDSVIYYQVVAVDSVFNHSIPSAPLRLKKPDKIAPVGVVITQFNQTKKGLWLNWNSSTSNDIKVTNLYRIEFSALTKILQLNPVDTLSYFHDTMVIPGKLYQYEFEIIDKSGNKTSVQSPVLKFEPGSRKSVEQFTAKANREKKIIELTWSPGTEPVYRYHVYRSKNNSEFTLIKTLDGKVNSFKDDALYINNTYSYKITATLQSGIKTEMSQVVVVEF